MKSNRIGIKSIVAWLYAAGVLAFLFFCYRYHIYFQEQFQLFEFTGRYFCDTVMLPGGLASYLSRFFTQFSYYAFAGAAICTAIISAIRVLSCKLGMDYALSFVPSSLMLFFMLDGEAMLTAPVALLFVLAVACLCRGTADCGWMTLLISALLYLLAGPLAVVYPALMLDRAKRWYIWGVLCAVAFCIEIFLAHQITHYPYGRLLYGLEYYRLFNGAAMPWLAALSAVVLFHLSRTFVLKGKVEAAICALVLVGTSAGVCTMADFKREESMAYDFLVRRGMWDTIIARAQVKSPDTPNNVTCLNLALAMKGELRSRMFNFFQCGTEGLMPPIASDYVSSLPVSEVYFYLGMINTARRFTFATQENNPNGQHSARCYKRLAETNMINGLYDAATLYLKPLKKTLFYRKWAEDFSRLMASEEAIEKHPLYGFLRKSRLHDADFMFNRSTTDSMLAYLINENPKNSIAYEYLYGWLLLDKNIGEFKALFGIKSNDQFPSNYWNYYNTFKKKGERQ